MDIPFPADEAERLEKLRGLGFERFSEADFARRLTEIAQARFDTDVSFVGIVEEEKENFLACAGADPDAKPREHSACTYTILEDTVNVIEDMHEDERFTENEAVHEMGMRWYAGVPISIEGQNVGTFCLMDATNRSFDEHDRDHLRGFAEEVEDQLVLRNQLYDMKEERISDEVRQKLQDR